MWEVRWGRSKQAGHREPVRTPESIGSSLNRETNRLARGATIGHSTIAQPHARPVPYHVRTAKGLRSPPLPPGPSLILRNLHEKGVWDKGNCLHRDYRRRLE